MTTKSNSFKLQRLSKTMGIHDRSISQFQPKQAVKLPALNSITLGVKYNDLSFVTGRDLNKLRKEPEVGDDLQYESAHHNLSAVRKNFDSMHKQKTNKETSISKLKEDHRKLKIIQTELIDKREGGRKKVENFHKKLQDIKLLYTEADMQKKVLLNMRDHLKHDRVVYDQRKFNMEKQLRFLRKQQQVIKIDKTDKDESDDRTNKLYRKLLAQLKEEQNERQSHLLNLQTMIEEKERMNSNNLYRSQEMQDIAERAMQDKDENQKSWEKLYMTNKFLDRMLRNKMDKEMSKFFIVESAFKTIKIATGVSDAESLVKKFLNKEETYGDLLSKIAENEKQIQLLKQESEQLTHEYKEIEAEKQVIDSTKITKVQITGQTKKLEETENMRQRANLNKEKLRTWLSKNTKKVNSILGSKHQLRGERDLNSIKENFISYLKIISTQLEQIAKDETEIKQNFQPEEKIKNEIKLLRIKQKNQSNIEADESEDEGHLNHEQGDLISGQRNQVHRVNEKAMKEIKRKHQQLRKMKMEQASPKKRDPEPPKKAPEND